MNDHEAVVSFEHFHDAGGQRAHDHIAADRRMTGLHDIELAERIFSACLAKGRFAAQQFAEPGRGGDPEHPQQRPRSAVAVNEDARIAPDGQKPSQCNRHGRRCNLAPGWTGYGDPAGIEGLKPSDCPGSGLPHGAHEFAICTGQHRCGNGSSIVVADDNRQLAHRRDDLVIPCDHRPFQGSRQGALDLRHAHGVDRRC